jgi:hypothetical protein
VSGDPARTVGDPQRDWEAVRASGDIQFAPVAIPKQVPPELPGWLKWLGEHLEALFKPLGRWLGIGWPVLEKILIGLAIIAAALVVWRLVVWLAGWFAARRRQPRPELAQGWTPDRGEALALLSDADRLAAEGRFGAAVHLLLVRSVGQIGAARPEWLVPASTARDIAALPALPERARAAFRIMAERAERSLFALRELGPADWQAARGAYADFALEQL